MTKPVEKEIQANLPDKFALVFNGWFDSETHYVDVFESFPNDDKTRLPIGLLSFSHLGDEESQSAREHVEFLTFQLKDVFKKNWSNVVCIVADNRNTNNVIANTVGVSLVCCACHRFNLALESFLQKHEDFV